MIDPDVFDLELSAYAMRRLAEEQPTMSFPWVARLLADVVERAVSVVRESEGEGS